MRVHNSPRFARGTRTGPTFETVERINRTEPNNNVAGIEASRVGIISKEVGLEGCAVLTKHVEIMRDIAALIPGGACFLNPIRGLPTSGKLVELLRALPPTLEVRKLIETKT